MRLKECTLYEMPDHMEKCQKLKEDFDKVSESFFIKCKYFILHVCLLGLMFT